MFRLATILLLFTSITVTGQNLKIQEIKKHPKLNFYDTNQVSIIYPVIITNNNPVNKKINDTIIASFAYSEFNGLLIDAQLDSAIATNLVALTYTVTYNQNNILSIMIDAEGCGAYCSNWTSCFNFDLKTGASLSVKDFLKNDKYEIFKNKIQKQKTEALIDYQKDLKQSFEKKEVDKETYEWAIDEVTNNCMKSLSLDEFILYPNNIVLYDDCDFPHAIRGFQPVYNFNYKYSDIKDLLKPTWQTIFIKWRYL